MPLPNIPKEMLCQARSKRTGLPCKNVKAHSCNVCRMHGAHRPQKTPSGEDHWNFKHGKATKKKRAEDSINSTRLLLLVDLGRRLELFGENSKSPAGRKPDRYPKTDDMSLSEIVEHIENLR
jgi:hypothetical protein